MEDGVKVITNDSRKKNIDLKNIEPISNIQIVRSEAGSSDLESELSEISEYIKPKKKKKNIVQPKKQRQQQFGGDYNAFLNPKKVRTRDIEEDSVDDESSEYSSVEESDQDSEASYENQPKEKTFEEKQKMKQDLLIKIQAMEKKGFEFSKKFNMTSNYEEMMFEYEKVKKFIESQAAIKFSRRCLMACVTGIEFLNKKFDPFNVKLEGWSENVMESVDDYDNIFERLHEKYSGKGEIAPEIELLLTLGGSAFMFHLTNSLLKSPSMGPINTIAQNNPNFMQSMMGMMSQGMKSMAQEQPNRPQQSNFPKPMETRGIRKEMNGPSIDPALFAGTSLPTKYAPGSGPVNNYPQPPEPVDFVQQYYGKPIEEDDRFSVASSDSSLSSVSVVKKINIKKGGKNQLGGLELNIS
jgi:hypothetical protein